MVLLCKTEICYVCTKLYLENDFKFIYYFLIAKLLTKLRYNCKVFILKLCVSKLV